MNGQLSILDLIPEQRFSDIAGRHLRDRDADVLAYYFEPWALLQTILSLDSSEGPAALIPFLISCQTWSWSSTRFWSASFTGIRVSRFPGQPIPWSIPWPRVWQVLAARTSPTLTAALAASIQAQEDHRAGAERVVDDAWSIGWVEILTRQARDAEAILPRRSGSWLA